MSDRPDPRAGEPLSEATIRRMLERTCCQPLTFDESVSVLREVLRLREGEDTLRAERDELRAVIRAVVEEDGFRGSCLMRKRIDAMRAALAKHDAAGEAEGAKS